MLSSVPDINHTLLDSSTILFSKDQLSNFATINQYFHRKGPEVCKVLKLCYISLRALYHEDKSSNEILEDRGMFHLFSSNSSFFPLSVVHMVWRELLELEDGDRKDEEEEDIENLFESSYWKHFLCDEERDNFIQYVKVYYQNDIFFRVLGSEEVYASINKQVLIFIQDCLSYVGILELKEGGEFSNNVKTELKQDYERKQIGFDLSHCSNYGIFSFQDPNEFFNLDQNNISKDVVLNVFNDVVASCCLKVSSYIEESAATIAQRDYALTHLPFHLMDTARIDEVLHLLCSSEYFKDRVSFYSVCMSCKMHGKDCLNLHYFLTTYNMDEIKKKVASCFFRIIDYLEEVKDEVKCDDSQCGLSHSALLIEELGWKKEAVVFYQQVLKYQQLTSSIDVAFTFSRLGAIYAEFLDYGKSLKYYEEALYVQRHVLGDHHPFVLETCSKIARINMVRGDDENAAIYYEMLLSMKSKVFGPNSIEVAMVKKDLGDLHYIANDYKNALNLYTEAFEIAFESKEENLTLVAALCFIIGNIYGKLGKYKLAIEFFDKTLSHRQKYDGKNHKGITGVLRAKGDLYLHVKDLNLSISCYRNALMVAKSFQDEESVAQIQKKLAFALEQQEYKNGKKSSGKSWIL